MNIGELAKQSGLAASRIRFYEAEGLISQVGRQSNGYRRYSAEALQTLQLIQSAQQAGFTLQELKALMPAPGEHKREELIEALERKVVKDAFEVHKRKGTVGALRRVVEPFADILDITEWHELEPMGEPGTFTMSLALIGGLIDGERDVAAIIAALDAQFPGVPELGDDIEQFMEVARAQHWIELV